MKNELKVKAAKCNGFILVALLIVGLTIGQIGIQNYQHYCQTTPFADSIH